MHFPDYKPLPGIRSPLPYVIVGDEAFPLKKYLMKPFPQRQLYESKMIFTYRLSRARRIVEFVFGILSSRFRVLKHAIPLEPDKAEVIVQACCAFHNFLRSKTMSQPKYSPPGVFYKENERTGAVTPGQWRQEHQCHPSTLLAYRLGIDQVMMQGKFAKNRVTISIPMGKFLGSGIWYKCDSTPIHALIG